MDLIIGGGIAGLILAFSNPRKKIITKGKSQWNNKITLGPRYLHYSKYTEKLLKKLNLSIKTKYIHIGYQDNLNYCKANGDFLDKYSKCSGRQGQKTSATMNCQKDKIKIFEVSEAELGKKLFEIINNRKQIINKKVKKINPFFIQCEDGTEFKFSMIYNTIPINALMKILNLDAKPFKFSSIYFKKLPNKKKDKYDMVYCINNGYYRYTFTEDGCIAESVNPIEDYFCKLEFGKIIYEKRIEELEKYLWLKFNIILIGRYARHNPYIKINDIIENVMKV